MIIKNVKAFCRRDVSTLVDVMTSLTYSDVKPEKLVLAHMGGLNFWDDVEKYLVGENVYFDTAYVADEMSEEHL